MMSDLRGAPFSDRESEIVRAVAKRGDSSGVAVAELGEAGFRRSRSAVMGWASRNKVHFFSKPPNPPRDRVAVARKPKSDAAPRSSEAVTSARPNSRFFPNAPKGGPGATIKGQVAAMFAEANARTSSTPRRRASMPWPTAEAQVHDASREAAGDVPAHKGCKWPTGDVRTGIVWCNAPQWRESVYCGHHYARAYVHPSKRAS